MNQDDQRRPNLDPRGNGLHDQPAIVERPPERVCRSESVARLERFLEEMKNAPEVVLESTYRLVQLNPEDEDTIHDTCDVLGPWDTLYLSEKLAALDELDWRGVGPDDKQRIVDRELAEARPPRAREDADRPRIADQQANGRATPDDQSRDR